MTNVHVLSDESLGGIKREYVEVDRPADVGDYVYVHKCEECPEANGKVGKCVEATFSDGSIDIDIPSKEYGDTSFLDAEIDRFTTLEPLEPAPPTHDVVNHPQHYNAGKFEVIDVITDVTDVLAKAGASGAECYAIGNVLKYVMRYRLKNGAEDLRKAKWYIDKAIAEMSE